MAQIASQLIEAVEGLLGSRLPFRLQAWDGSTAGAVDAPLLVLRNRRALRRLLWSPASSAWPGPTSPATWSSAPARTSTRCWPRRRTSPSGPRCAICTWARAT